MTINPAKGIESYEFIVSHDHFFGRCCFGLHQRPDNLF